MRLKGNGAWVLVRHAWDEEAARGWVAQCWEAGCARVCGVRGAQDASNLVPTMTRTRRRRGGIAGERGGCAAGVEAVAIVNLAGAEVVAAWWRTGKADENDVACR